MNGISTIYKRDTLPLPSREVTAKTQMAMHQETALHETLNCCDLDLGLPSPQNCEKYIPVVYKPRRTTVCHIIKATQKNKDSGTLPLQEKISTF